MSLNILGIFLCGLGYVRSGLSGISKYSEPLSFVRIGGHVMNIRNREAYVFPSVHDLPEAGADIIAEADHSQHLWDYSVQVWV